jgi:hypothetical protein
MRAGMNRKGQVNGQGRGDGNHVGLALPEPAPQIKLDASIRGGARSTGAVGPTWSPSHFGGREAFSKLGRSIGLHAYEARTSESAPSTRAVRDLPSRLLEGRERASLEGEAGSSLISGARAPRTVKQCSVDARSRRSIEPPSEKEASKLRRSIIKCRSTAAVDQIRASFPGDYGGVDVRGNVAQAGSPHYS